MEMYTIFWIKNSQLNWVFFLNFCFNPYQTQLKNTLCDNSVNEHKIVPSPWVGPPAVFFLIFFQNLTCSFVAHCRCPPWRSSCSKRWNGGNRLFHPPCCQQETENQLRTTKHQHTCNPGKIRSSWMSESNIYSRDQKCCLLKKKMTCLGLWHWNEQHWCFDGALLRTVKTRQWQAREQSDVILQSRWEYQQPADYRQLYKLYVILAHHLLAL